MARAISRANALKFLAKPCKIRVEVQFEINYFLVIKTRRSGLIKFLELILVFFFLYCLFWLGWVYFGCVYGIWANYL